MVRDPERCIITARNRRFLTQAYGHSVWWRCRQSYRSWDARARAFSVQEKGNKASSAEDDQGCHLCRRRILVSVASSISLNSLIRAPASLGLGIIDSLNSDIPAERGTKRNQIELSLSQKSILDAREELKSITSILESSVVMETDPDWNRMNKIMENGSLKRIKKYITDVDTVVGTKPLADWEKEAWRGLSEPSNDAPGSLLPFIERPNAFLCAVFSCMNSPQQPAGTDAVLVVDMLRQGIALGQRGDPRATAEGVLLTAGDALAKMDDYITFIMVKRGGN